MKCTTCNAEVPINAVVDITMNTVANLIKLQVTGDLSDVVWLVNGQKLRVGRDGYLILELAIEDTRFTELGIGVGSTAIVVEPKRRKIVPKKGKR